jgi:hypothetical protein
MSRSLALSLPGTRPSDRSCVRTLRSPQSPGTGRNCGIGTIGRLDTYHINLGRLGAEARVGEQMAGDLVDGAGRPLRAGTKEPLRWNPEPGTQPQEGRQVRLRAGLHPAKQATRSSACNPG